MIYKKKYKDKIFIMILRFCFNFISKIAFIKFLHFQKHVQSNGRKCKSVDV